MMKSLGTAREREIYPNEKQKAKYSIACQDKILGDSYFRITANYDLSNIASEKVYCNSQNADFGVINQNLTSRIFPDLAARRASSGRRSPELYSPS